MTNVPRRPALLFALHLLCMGALALPLPAAAMQILDAADHAELRAEISATNVNRIALAGDRIAKVVRAPGGFAVEHDAASGDLYLRPSVPAASADPAGEPITLFIGTEKGFTYRMTLTPVERDSAQILIRNAAVAAAGAAAGPAPGGPHVAALVKLVRAVARREPLPGYEIRAGGDPLSGFGVIETWRGPRFLALVLEADTLPAASADGVEAGLAGTIGALPAAGRLAALWLAAPGTGPSGGRLAVAVVNAGARGTPR
ncbi:MAG: hypothetical protein F4204_12085 [Rhodospirillaceae bacterium]|nr:hypothetical protein [Rhodospirillaceae bacterium]